jgi:hypothetical protein
MTTNEQSTADFLQSLDARLSKIEKGSYCKKPTSYLSGTNEPISLNEINRIFELLGANDYALYPTNMNMGFREGFSLYQIEHPTFPGIPATSKRVLSFSFKQVENEVPWQDFSDKYMAPRNLELLRLIGVKNDPSPSRGTYTY